MSSIMDALGLCFCTGPDHTGKCACQRGNSLKTQFDQTTEALSIHKELYVELLKQNIKLEEKLAKAVEALDESLYFLQPDERDMSKQAGKYRIVKAYEEITGQEYQVDDDKEKNDREGP